jgi:hypothetical protein
MLSTVAEAYQQIDDARPLVRPTYNQFEITLLPPFGDPEVHIPSEFGTYFAAGLFVSAVTELLNEK